MMEFEYGPTQDKKEMGSFASENSGKATLDINWLPQTRRDKLEDGYQHEGHRATEAEEVEDLFLNTAYIGSCFCLLDPETKGMLYLTTLPLAGGQEGDEASSRPDPNLRSKVSRNASPADEGISTEDGGVLADDYLLILVTNTIM
jgi:hypothetical protein